MKEVLPCPKPTASGYAIPSGRLCSIRHPDQPPPGVPAPLISSYVSPFLLPGLVSYSVFWCFLVFFHTPFYNKPCIFKALQPVVTTIFIGFYHYFLESPKYVEKYQSAWNATLLLPAGITSECSIRYKDEDRLLDGAGESVDDVYVEKVLPGKMKIDLKSLKKFSLFYELGTMVRTVLAVLGKE